MKIRRLPSLNALRAFDTAARRLSITLAAKELHVTHGAVSRQIKHLEGDLQVQLFRRLPRKLELTAEGRMLAFSTQQAFTLLQDAINQFGVQASGRRQIAVSTVASMASGWLVPRLQQFQRQHENLEVRLSISKHLVDFEAENIDLAIRYGAGRWKGLHAERLLPGKRIPVCAPSLLAKQGNPENPEDLLNFPLIHDTNIQQWQQWFTSHDITFPTPESSKGAVADELNVLIRMAVSGAGIILVPEAIVADELCDRKLVRIAEKGLETPMGYYIVCPPAHMEQTDNITFINWLKEQAGDKRCDPDEWPEKGPGVW